MDANTLAATGDLATDREMAADLKVGLTSFFTLQKEPDFPPPVWLGPRLKRHVRARVMAWALTKRAKPTEGGGRAHARAS